MNRFILTICLMSVWSGLSLAATQFHKLKDGVEITIEISGTGEEKNVEDFKSDVPMIKRHLALSQSFIENYAEVFLMAELEILNSDLKIYIELIDSSSDQTQDEESKKKIEEFKQDYMVLFKDLWESSQITTEKKLEIFKFMSTAIGQILISPHSIEIYKTDNLDALNKSLEHSNQCANMEDETIDSDLLSEIKDLCLFFNDAVQNILPLEQSRLNLPDSEICNGETRCSNYNDLMNQIRYRLQNVVSIPVGGLKEMMNLFNLGRSLLNESE